MKEGYLYVAIGEKYFKEALVSISSLKKVDANANITIVTDMKSKFCKKNEQIFDNVIIESPDVYSYKHNLLLKVKALKNSSYEKTFYVDSDTYFCDSCTELFKLLDYFDLCIANGPCDPTLISIDNKVLEGYYSYNSGVILFNKNSNVDNFLLTWYHIYKSGIEIYKTDQNALMRTFLINDLNLKTYVLRNIYNARTNFCIEVMPTKVKIIHGRHLDFEEVNSCLNSYSDYNRAWNGYDLVCIARKDQ